MRATQEQLRPATSAEWVLRELQNTSLDVVNNLPIRVAVDLPGQVGPTEENIDDDTIMVGPPEETQPPGDAKDPSEHESEEVESESDQSPSAQTSDQELRFPAVPAVGPELSESQTDQQQLPGPSKIDIGTSVVTRSQDQARSLET